MGDSTQFSEIWEDALRVYQAETHRDLLKDKALAALKTTDDLLAYLEAQEGNFKSFMEKKRKLWSVLKASMEPVRFLGDAAQAALQGTPFASAGAIFVATSYLIRSAKGVSDAYASIIELLEQLADFSDRLDEYSKDVIDGKLRKKITLILATLLEILGKAERAIARGRVKEFARIAFLGKDDGVADALNRLQLLVEAEGRFVSAKTLSTTQKLDKDIGKISSSLIESRKEKMEDGERKIVDEALSSGAVLRVQEIQARNTNERQTGSGDWLKNEKLYKSWLKAKEPILWILGGPGSGKSFLASIVVSHLQDMQSEVRGSSSISVGYFYIQEDDAQLRSLNTILKSIAYQLQDNNPVYAKYLVKACSNSQKTITAADTWKNLFLDYFGSSQYGEKIAFIVLDGLDEAPRKERDALFKLLKDLGDVSEIFTRSRIQVLLIGRPDLRDDTVFIWGKPIIYIEVSARKTKDDILAYIKSNVVRVRALKQAKEPLESRLKLRKEIITKLSDGANGMFLWVNLMLDQIYDMSRPSDINNALNDAPKSLSKMIRHIFERLEEDLRGFRKDDFKEILSWISCAKRPLYLAELRTVLQLRPPLGEGVPDLEERLRGQFASFFTLTRRDGMTTEALLELAAVRSGQETVDANTGSEDINGIEGRKEDNSDDESVVADKSSEGGFLPEVDTSDPYNSEFHTTVIQFSHASIRDYLVRESNPATREFTADLGISINTIEAEKHLAITCLQVLTEGLRMPADVDWDSDCSDDEDDSDNDSGTEDEQTPNDTFPVYDLEDYASDNFIKHLTLTQKSTLTSEEEQLITRALINVFVNHTSLTHWIDGSSNLALLATEWMSGAKYAEFVRGWFLDQLLNNNYYNESEVEQMKKLSESDQELLKGFAMECARCWLTIDNEDDNVEGYVSFLNTYVPTDGDEIEHLKSNMIGSKPTATISEARLLRLAEFASLEKTSFWHGHVAEALSKANYIDAAIKGFHTAIELNDQNWIAMGRLSFCYESLQVYDLAAEWSRKALQVCPITGHKWDRAQYWQTIASCLLDIGDIDGAKTAVKEASNLKPENGDILSTYIFILDAAGDHSELLSYLENLESRISDNTGENLLTAALLANDYLLEVIGYTARAAGKLEDLIKAQERVIEAAARSGDLAEVANQQALLGNLYYTQLKDQKKAVEFWDLVLKSKGATADLVQQATDDLSTIYYAEAMRSQLGEGKGTRRWITKLEKAAKYNHDANEASPSDASLMLGVWYREQGNIVEARNCCRAYVLQALDMLSDDDPYNDSGAWFSLSASLMKAGDRVNATAAYAILNQGFDTLKEVLAERKSSASKQGEEKSAATETEFSTSALSSEMAAMNMKSTAGSTSLRPTIPGAAHPRSYISSFLVPFANSTMLHAVTLSWYCDGQCRRSPEIWRELYICEICINTVCFCEQCIDLIRNDKLEFKVCDPIHTWYKAYPIKEGWGKVRGGLLQRDSGGAGKDMILVDGKAMELDAWLNNLRQEWTKTSPVT